VKVYISNYRDHWISPYTVLDYIFFWTPWSKCSRNKWIVEDKDWVDHPAWVEKAVVYIDPFSRAVRWILDIVHPRIQLIKIDRYDTWSMDHTLADIILPMLKQLNETKNGAPHTDDEDVPEYLRSYMAQPKENEWDTDSLHFMRWDWILGEMIWAFEQKVDDDAEGQFFDHSDCPPIDDFPKNPNEHFSKTKYDKEGHKKWLDRKANGFRLFGKYYEALWD
jgi:hypothetical protein